jgi:nitroreductase
MNVSEAIYSRRAVRSYSPQPVDDVTINSLLRAAVQAPSAMNAEPWGFVVLQDRQRLDAFSTRAKAMLLEEAPNAKARHYVDLFRSEEFNIFYDASTLIVICARNSGPYVDADAWLAAQNLMLAACELGLGSCCIGFAIPVLNTPETKRELHIPAQGTAVAPIIVGYPSGEVTPVPREPPQILSWNR